MTTPKLPTPTIMLITDRQVCGGVEQLVRAVAAAVNGGVNAVQLREKDMPAGQLARLAERLRHITEGRALLLINDRVDVALATGADGVELGEESLSVAEARRIANGRPLLIGRSVHDVDGARKAAKAGADLLQLGTIYTTESHPGVGPSGPALVREVAQAVKLPVIAVGGITAATAAEVIHAGASGVAVIRNILAAASPEQAARDLVQAVVSFREQLAPYRDTGLESRRERQGRVLP